MDATPDSAKRDINPGETFEGSRPGKGTALLAAGAVCAFALYSFWPQIASALNIS